MKEKLLKFKNSVCKFVQSDWFIVLNALLILLGWSLDIWVPMLSVIAAINVLPLFFDRQTKHLFNLLMMFSFIMNTSRNDLMPYTPMLSLVLVMFVGIIFNSIFFKRSFVSLHPKNIKGFHASLLALIFPFAFAGVSSPAEVPLLTVAILALIILIGALYSFFTVCYYGTEERKQLPEYVLKILVASGVIVALEMIIVYAKVGNINDILQMMMSKKVHIGWAGPNNMAPLLSMAIPATLYFCIKKNYATPVLAAIALIEYALIFTTGCRGAILFTTLAMPAMLFYTLVKSENKLAFGATITVIFMVAVVLIAYYGDLFAGIFTTILNKRLESSGREELYKLAVDAFKTWPIFGAGWDYKTDLFFHSTFFQIIATMGVFGLIIFAVFYLWRYWTFFKLRKEPSTLALLASSILFEAYGMIDTNYFIPNFFLIMLFMTFAVEINVPEKSCLAFGGKDPVAHVVGFFRILADKVKPVKASDPYAQEPSQDVDQPQEETIDQPSESSAPEQNEPKQPSETAEQPSDTGEQPPEQEIPSPSSSEQET